MKIKLRGLDPSKVSSAVIHDDVINEEDDDEDEEEGCTVGIEQEVAGSTPGGLVCGPLSSPGSGHGNGFDQNGVSLLN